MRMPSVNLVVAIAMAPFSAGPASAAEPALEFRPLTGTYAVAGRTLIDPPADEPRRSHVYLELTGAAARELYAALPGRAVPDRCGEPGALLKQSGGLQCTREQGGAHRCSFGVELATRRIVAGSVC